MPLAYGVGFALLPAAIRALESPYCLRQYGRPGRCYRAHTPDTHRLFFAPSSPQSLHHSQKNSTKTRPHPRPLSHGERGACFTKNKKPHQTPTSPPAPLPWGEGSMLHKKQKALTQPPTSPPAPLPLGEGSMLHKKQKASPNPQKGSTFTTPQASPPHEMRKGRMA